MKSINIEKGVSTIKAKFIQRNPTTGKAYAKYLRIIDDEGNWFPIRSISVKKPSDKLIEMYEKKRKRFTDKLYNEILEDIKVDNKLKKPMMLTCKVCNYK